MRAETLVDEGTSHRSPDPVQLGLAAKGSP
jgi:hypothetical protein